MSPSRFGSVVTHLICILEVLDSNLGWGLAFITFSLIFPEEYWFYVFITFPEETFLNPIKLSITIPFCVKSL